MIDGINQTLLTTATFVATFLMTGFLLAYPVAYPFNLEQLNAQADIIVKVVALESEPLKDKWFEKVRGYDSVTTRLKIISVIKGDLKQDEIAFQHYSLSSQDFLGMYAVQSYELEIGRPYILLAKKTDSPNVFRQCWKNHTLKMDQGMLLAASDQPIRFDNIKDSYWYELTQFLTNEYEEDARREKDVNYAISQLDLMSAGKEMGVSHFDRGDALRKIAPFINDRDGAVVRRAIEVLASKNPYATAIDNPFWLASKGRGNIPGFSDTYKDYMNLGGTLYWKQLTDVVDSGSSNEIRAMAIRAMGTVRRPEIEARLASWLEDENASIVAAATALLGDYPGQITKERLKKAIRDGDETVRQAAAHAIGNGQQSECIDLLELLLLDKQPKVAKSSAISLLSFSYSDSNEVLKRNLKNEHFGLLFAIALAKLGEEGAELYLEPLCQAAKISIFDHNSVSQWWGGQHPSGQAWEILLEYANSKTAAEIEATEFQPVIEALESSISTNPMKGLQDADSTEDWKSVAGSNVPAGIYKLYVSKGLDERAANFRKLCKKRLSFDAEVYFKRIDTSKQ